MATIRIQVRRGLASQWTSVNPTLEAGEIGLETDTNKIKFGTGSTAWTALSYLSVGDIPEIAMDAINTALSLGSGLTKSYSDATDTISISLDTAVVATLSGTQTLTNKTLTSPVINTPTGITKSDVGLANVDNTSDANKPVSTASQTALDLKAPLASPTFTGTVAGVTKAHVGLGNVDNTSDASKPISTATQTALDLKATSAALANHEADTTSIHGITDTALLATMNYVDTAVGALSSSVDTNFIEVGDRGTMNGVAPLNASVKIENSYLTADVVLKDETQTLTNKSLAAPAFTGTATGVNMTLSGDLMVNGTTTIINSTAVNVNNQVIFEGATPNEFETTLTTVEPTADRSISLPDATGTIVLADNTQTLSNKSINLNANTITTTLAQLNTAVSDADLVTLSGLETLTGKTLTSPKINEDVALGATSTELNILDGATLSTAELNILDGVTASTAELNKLAGVTATTAEINKLAGVTATTAEINKLAGVTATSAEINALSGLTSTSSELNILDGVTVTAAEINVLDGITATTAELNKLAGVTATSAEINTLTGITSTAAELNILDGATLSVTELNYVDGVTSAIQTQLNNKQAVVTDVSDTEIGYLNGVTSAIQTQLNAKAPSSSPTFTGTVVLPSGTVTSTMILDGTIVNADINATAAIDWTKISASSTISEIELGYLDGVTSAIQTQINGKQATVANVSDVEIGYLDGVTSSIQTQINNKQAVVANVSDTEIGYLDGVTSAIQTQINAKLASATAASTYAPLAGPTFTGTVVLPSTTSIGNITSTELGYVDGVTSAIQTQIDDKLNKSGGTMTGALTLSGAPTSDLHAATKIYVDNVTAGINFHESVHAASTINVAATYSNGTSGVGATLTASTNRAFDTLDGESVVVGERVLIKNQTDAKHNGIYVLTTNGSVSTPWVLTRATDADNNPTGEMKTGDFTFVQRGTVNASVGYINNSTTNPIVIGTDNISYTEFSAAKTVVAGNGLSEATPGTLSIDTSITATKASVDLKAPLASPTFTGTVTLPAAGIVFTDGTQAKEGVPSRTPIIQKTAAYTLSALTERDSLIEMGSASALTLTIPADATLNFPIGTSIDILQTGAGQVTIAGSGFTPNATPGLKLRTTWSSATLLKRAANTWVVFGDLTA